MAELAGAAGPAIYAALHGTATVQLHDMPAATAPLLAAPAPPPSAAAAPPVDSAQSCDSEEIRVTPLRGARKTTYTDLD